jgi:hypothetical protein
LRAVEAAVESGGFNLRRPSSRSSAPRSPPRWRARRATLRRQRRCSARWGEARPRTRAPPCAR